LRPMHNRAGANLISGLVSAVVQQTSLGGAPQADVGLFEVDEATLPAAIRLLQPRITLLTNVFRDQLDRYGEVQFIYDTWRRGPDPQVVATSCKFHGDAGTELRVETPAGGFSARLRLPGLYNVYNALAATAVALGFGLAPSAIAAQLETFTAAFGRLERIKVE